MFVFCLPPHGDLSHRLFCIGFFRAVFSQLAISKPAVFQWAISQLSVSNPAERAVSSRTITVTAVCFLFIITYMLRDFHMFFKLFALAMACVKSVEKEKRAAGSPKAQDDKTLRAVP